MASLSHAYAILLPSPDAILFPPFFGGGEWHFATALPPVSPRKVLAMPGRWLGTISRVAASLAVRKVRPRAAPPVEKSSPPTPSSTTGCQSTDQKNQKVLSSNFNLQNFFAENSFRSFSQAALHESGTLLHQNGQALQVRRTLMMIKTTANATTSHVVFVKCA